MTDESIPESIAIATISLLAPYIPNLTSERLRSRLSFEPESIEKLYTRKEAASALSISTVTLDRMIAAGELPRRKIRGAVRIPQGAVTAIITGKAGA